MRTKTKKYDIFDITKYILSFMIIAIHTELFPLYLYPWLRIAVPLFFVISAYLLYSKIKEHPEEESAIVKKFITRQLKMYLFWFLILLPTTISTRGDWFANGIWMGIYNCIKNTIFSSTFIASWYITASIWAVFIIWKVSSKLNYKLITLIATIFYIICCLRSSYYVFLSNYPLYVSITKWFETIFVNPVFSFPIALFWINIGKLFADGKIKIKKPVYYIGIFASVILLYLEWRLVYVRNWGFTNDCYFFLAPLVICMFSFLIDHNIKIKNAFMLRKISIVTYPIHASLAKIYMLLVARSVTNNDLRNIISFVIVVIICHLVYFVIDDLSEYPKLSFLKEVY